MTVTNLRKADDDRFALDSGPFQLARRTAEVAAIAAEHAEAVDRDAAYPEAAMAAARRLGLLGVLVPTDLGGDRLASQRTAGHRSVVHPARPGQRPLLRRG